MKRTVISTFALAPLLTLLALAAGTPAARAQVDFDNDGDVITIVNNDVRIGFNTNDPIVVRSFSGTNIMGLTQVYDYANLKVTGGMFGDNVGSFGLSVIDLNSGYTIVGDVVAIGKSVNLRGGTIQGDLHVFGVNALNIYGTGLTSVAISSDAPNNNAFAISGTLLDGTILKDKTVYVSDDGRSSFKLHNAASPAPDVPEPGVIAFGVLAAGSVVGLIARRLRGTAQYRENGV